MKNLKYLVLVVLLASCTDAKQSKLNGFGKRYKIEVLNGGQIIRTYTSSGKISSEHNSDGYYFNDEATNKLIEVSGDVIITEL